MIIDCADGLEHFFRRPNGQFTVGGGRGWFVHFGAHFGDGKKDEKIGSKKVHFRVSSIVTMNAINRVI